jgi:hypothetical protein
MTEIRDPRYWRQLANKTRFLALGAHPETTEVLLEIASACDELARRAQKRARRALEQEWRLVH